MCCFSTVLTSTCAQGENQQIDKGASSAHLASPDAQAQGQWLFNEGGHESTRLMNLLNLPMLKSAAVRKMTSSKPVSQPQQATESLKHQIRREFALSMGLTDPEGNASHNGRDQVDDAPASIAGDSEQTVKKQKVGGKTAQKQNAFKGYDERERAAYCVEIRAFDEAESRPITSLDEVLRALLFMCDLISKEQESTSGSGSAAAGASLAKAKAVAKKRKRSSAVCDDAEEEDGEGQLLQLHRSD